MLLADDPSIEDLAERISDEQLSLDQSQLLLEYTGDTANALAFSEAAPTATLRGALDLLAAAAAPSAAPSKPRRLERGKAGRCWCCLQYMPTTLCSRDSAVLARLKSFWTAEEVDRTSTQRGFNGERRHLCALCHPNNPIDDQHARDINEARTRYIQHSSKALKREGSSATKEDQPLQLRAPQPTAVPLHPQHSAPPSASLPPNSTNVLSAPVDIHSAASKEDQSLQLRAPQPTAFLPHPQPSVPLSASFLSAINVALADNPNFLNPQSLPPELEPSPGSAAELGANFAWAIRYALSAYSGLPGGSSQLAARSQRDLRLLEALRPSAVQSLAFLRKEDRDELIAAGWTQESFDVIGSRILERKAEAEASLAAMDALTCHMGLMLRGAWRARRRLAQTDLHKASCVISWPLKVENSKQWIHLCGSVRAECVARARMDKITMGMRGNLFYGKSDRTRSAAGIQVSLQALMNRQATVLKAQQDGPQYPPSNETFLASCDAVDFNYCMLNLELGQSMQDESANLPEELGLDSFSKP